jgi:hypothetical protein
MDMSNGSSLPSQEEQKKEKETKDQGQSPCDPGFIPLPGKKKSEKENHSIK